MNGCLDGLFFANLLLDIAPYNSDYWFKKGFFLNGLGKFGDAIECYDKTLSLNPGDSEILIDRASAEENLGLTAKARKSLEDALTGDPYNEDALFSLGVIHQQKEDYDIAIKNPGATHRQYYCLPSHCGFEVPQRSCPRKIRFW